MAGKVNIFTIFLVTFCLLPLACVGQRYGIKQAEGVYHRVEKGETLYRIAQAYKLSLHDLAEANHIDDPDMIEAGRVLFIPNAKYMTDDMPTSVKEAESKTGVSLKSAQISRKLPPGEDSLPSQKEMHPELPEASISRGDTKPHSRSQRQNISPSLEKGNRGNFPMIKGSAHNSSSTSGKDLSEDGSEKKGRTEEKGALSTDEEKKLSLERKRFVWPLEGKLVARFGIQQNGMFFNGIRIKAREGTPVVAAASGTVIFSAVLKDYGETIIMKHEDNFATVYANLGKRLVKCDDQVKKGEKIALTASAMPEREPMVHFEIRQNNKARDPLFFLR